MQKFENFLYKLLCYTCGLLILGMTLLIFGQVLCRYVMNNSLTWSEEIGRYMFVWITFVGLPVALKYGAHVSIDLLLKKTSGKFHLAVLTINAAVTALLGVLIFYSGIKLFNLGIGQVSSALQLPMQYVYSVIPFSGLALCFFAVTVYLDQRRKLAQGER